MYEYENWDIRINPEFLEIKDTIIMQTMDMACRFGICNSSNPLQRVRDFLCHHSRLSHQEQHRHDKELVRFAQQKHEEHENRVWIPLDKDNKRRTSMSFVGYMSRICQCFLCDEKLYCLEHEITKTDIAI